MDKNRSHVTEAILNLTLRIIYQLTGKDYVAEQECSVCATTRSSRTRVSGGGSRSQTQSPITETPPHSLVSERDNDQNILELTNKIIQLLTGEVPIRCQDVTVYLSMEEWEYLEGHRDLYKDVMLENHRPLTSLDLHQVDDLRRGFGTNDSSSGCTLDDQSAIAMSPTSDANTTRNKNEHSVTCDDENLTGTDINTPKDNTQYPFTDIKEEPVLCDGGTLTDTDLYKPTGHTQYTSARIKEESVSYNGKNIYRPTNHRQNTSAPIKEESVLCKKVDGVDLDIHKPTDNTQYTAVPIHDELMQLEEGIVTDTDRYTPTDGKPTQYTITGEPYSWTVNIKAKCKDVLGKPKSDFNRPNKPVYPCPNLPQNTDRTFACSECEKHFTSESGLIKHQSLHTQPESRFARSNLATHHEKPRPAKSFPCDNSRIPPNHKSAQAGEKPFKCQHCGERFISKLELVTHQIVHIKRPYSCSQCRRCFFSRSGLATHQKTHTVQKLFQCPVCRKSFISKAYLVLHEETHTDSKASAGSGNGEYAGDDPKAGKAQSGNAEEKSFTCPDCGECFYSSERYLQHQSRHLRHSPFICSDCGKCFRRKAGLSKHQRVIHQGGAIFSCFGCGKGFACKSELVRHLTVHTGEKPFSCTDCGKCFSFKSALVRHQRIHNGDRPHSCSECGKGFSCTSDLRRHQSVHQRTFSCNL